MINASNLPDNAILLPYSKNDTDKMTVPLDLKQSLAWAINSPTRTKRMNLDQYIAKYLYEFNRVIPQAFHQFYYGPIVFHTFFAGMLKHYGYQLEQCYNLFYKLYSGEPITVEKIKQVIIEHYPVLVPARVSRKIA